ncbi:DUF5690 family protein [Microbulbifer pacificus]|uniref:DUF5690 family protein n=1 Tax=Microbulbifer pacificus TaxID=407164 RepID=A0AAU0MZ05_9GAMM|nr:DUF5690 family protein [Microbulbifer pacificus]WOX04986.1 DUF5690 family protein [Microbulbifer pacificus]
MFSGLAAFSTYFCMYAFRKPFSAATFSDVEDWHFEMDYKTALIIAQVLGYALSKFAGIKVVSEMQPQRRAWILVAMLLVSHLALVGFALLPAPLNVTMLFINGIPLGMVWGLVFSYLEGRRVTEALGAILCAALIVSSGAVKAVAAYLLVEWQVPELWMPALVGALFIPPLLVSVWLLARTPAPDREDMAARKPRPPMDAAMRNALLQETGLGLAALVAVYVFLTAFRDFTDNFAAELWSALGYGEAPEIFLTSTLPVTLVVLGSLWLLMFIRSNYLALVCNQLVVAGGGLLCIAATYAFENRWIDGASWMIAINTGLYMGFIPFNCLLFERLVAASRSIANAGFLIYLADASGYAGSICVLLYKTFAQPDLAWLPFTLQFSYVAGGACMLLIVVSLLYFRKLDPDMQRDDSVSTHTTAAST